MAGPDTSGQTQALSGSNKPIDLEEWKKRYRQSKDVRERFIPEWYMNLAFYLGQQWLHWAGGRLAKPQLATWRKTPVDNRILPIVTSRTARKVKNRPTFLCVPNTGDEADIEATKIGEKVLSADWINLDLQQKLYQTILYSEITGAGFWKIYWDSTLGESNEFLFGPDGKPIMDQNGKPLRSDAMAELPEGVSKRTIAQGDVAIDVIAPFELFPDPLATSLEEVEWVIEEKVRSVEYVKRRFNKELPPDAAAPIGPMESRMSASLTGGSGAASEYKGVKVMEGWARPSTDNPEGKHVVWAADQVLLDEDKPFDAMPYVMFCGIRAPNRFWPTSLTTQLRGPQIDLNKLEGQIEENASRLGNLSLMKSRQANVYYSGIPGEEVLYDSTVPDAVPQFLAPPEIPQYVIGQLERIENSMAEISGLHEVSKAQVPSGVTAASAINLLQEADDTRIGPEIQDMEHALAEAGEKILKLRARYNDDQRMIRIAGEDGHWDVSTFRSEMLRDNTNVEVQAGSAMPRSKAAKQAAMLEVLSLAFQYGLEFDPRDLRRFFKDYEVAALERLFESIGSDEQQVNREHRIMAGGQPLNINEWDDDEIHVSAHDEFRKSASFSRLDPQIQEQIGLHVGAHRERMVQQVNAQMAAQSMEGFIQQEQGQVAQQQQQEQQHAQQLEQQAQQQQAQTNASGQ